ncbi:hypothetical protein CB0940_01160 [Cercospora beticola]|uniref:Luciferase domain-containing protein n=1 Tax=Cercospora beticola TaxID=122368 RepID=A0A2G5ICN6_CERBT|nr:hypothetical protein CB0940_01160 [Cercospora beticola]PIB02578.1 hypothetical protein CB0940_01160 [Cercospora beticola]WPA96589.1 hypothetical protein RHO25_001196 [Cercospora beticola]
MITVVLLLAIVAGLTLHASWSVLTYIRKDYQDFLSLGPGGTPLTFTGYLKVKCLSIVALQDPFEAPPVPTRLANSPGHLENLPKRAYPRPLTRGIAPQRQTTQCSSPEIYSKLGAAIANMASCSGSRFELGTSCFEKYSTGIFSASPPRNQTCRGEICHAHPSDGSLHLTLHPKDVKLVLERGWGQRHPLARGGFFERFVPVGFVMIYAPQTEEDIVHILQIVAAAAKFICGEDRPQTRVSDSSHGTDETHAAPAGRQQEFVGPSHGPLDPPRTSCHAISLQSLGESVPMIAKA